MKLPSSRLLWAVAWVFVLGLMPQLTHASQTSPTGTWTLFWSDEFSGSGSVNSVDWMCDTGTQYPGGPSAWGTGEVESYSCSTDNIFQNGGNLNIRALHAGSDPGTGWTSGRIETARSDFQPPGGGIMAVEARIKLPDVAGSSAQGYWSAFWMLGAPYRGNYWNWPDIGEIDILENVNGYNQWSVSLHCGQSPRGPCNEPTGLSSTASGFVPSVQNDFHTYRVEFDKSVLPQQIRWYIDGVQRFAVNSNQIDSTAWKDATEHGFFILLNVAMGGAAGPPTYSTASGGTMLVDYVHVYLWSANTAGDSCSATLSADLTLIVPIVNYAGQAYWADFAYVPNTMDIALTTVGVVADTSQFSTCTPATLSPSLQFHFGSTPNLWSFILIVSTISEATDSKSSDASGK
jgi:beta-glucanase (GH16 family)